MSKAAQLIADLGAEAEFESAGGFSLDREKARQKMRQFQLADPHRYVLLLVEAAALRGAQNIQFEIDSDDMIMRFDAPLTWADLDELYTSLFIDRSVAGVRARRQLALACNAMMALNPKFAVIESHFASGEGGRGGGDRPGQGGPGVQGVRATLRPDEDDDVERIEGAVPGVPAGTTRIHVKDRFRPATFVRFLLRDAIPEKVMLRRYCAMASRNIDLDGERISYGLPGGLLGGVRFDLDGLSGVGGLYPDRLDESSVVLMSNGVEITKHLLTNSVDGLWFWVDAPDFRKDVSQGDVVRRDPAYERVMAAIGPARDQILGRLAQAWQAGQFTASTTPTADQVYERLRRCFVRWADDDWLQADASALGLLCDMPFWRTADDRWVSTRDIAERHDPERGIMFSEAHFDGVVPLGWGPVIFTLGKSQEVEAVRRVFPQATNVTARLTEEVEWEENRRKWRAQPHDGRLPPTGMPVVTFEDGEFSGRLTLSTGPSSVIRVVVAGCLLCEWRPDLRPLVVNAVLSGPFELTADYTRPRRDTTFANGLVALLRLIPRALSEVAAQFSGEFAIYLLSRLAQQAFPIDWFEAFGFKRKTAERIVGELDSLVLMPALVEPPGFVDGEDAAPRLTPLGERLEFTTVDSRRVGLAAIDHARRHRARMPGKVMYVDRSALGLAAVSEIILHLDAAQQTLVRTIFGASRVVDDTRAYLSELGRRAFLARPQRTPGPLAAERVVEVDDGEVRGLVGLRDAQLRNWDPKQRRVAQIEVLVENRSLCRVDERTWLPGVTASLAWEGAPVDRDWEALSGSRAPLRRAIDRGLLAIVDACVDEVAAEGRRPDEVERRLLWLVLASPMLSTAHAAAWRALRSSSDDHDAAVERYFQVLALHPSTPLNSLVAALELVLEAGHEPDVETVMQVASRRVPKPAARTSHRFHVGVLERYPAIENTPLLQLTNGNVCTLAAVEGLFEATGEIAFVNDPVLQYDCSERMVLRVDRIDWIGLLRLFPREVMVDAEDWVHEQRRREAFEARRQLDELRVAEGDRLIGVEFEEGGFTGELAIPRRPPGGGGRMRLTLCHDRRTVGELEIAATVPVIGIIDDAHAELNETFTEVVRNSPRMAALRKFLAGVLSTRLLPALADRYAELSATEQGWAWSWMLTYLTRVCPRAGDFTQRLDEVGGRFADIPGFVDVGGGRASLRDLSARRREHGQVWYVDRDLGYDAEMPFPVLLCRPHEREPLARLFAEPRDFSERWLARVSGKLRRESARPLPELRVPEAAIASVPVERHGLLGYLWLPDSHPFLRGVVLGSGGKILTQVEPAPALPVQGVVGGVPANDAFTDADLEGRQQRYLSSRVVYLYSRLMTEHRHDMSRAERSDFLAAPSVHARGLRLRALRAAALELHRAQRQGAKFDAIVGNLAARLRDAPLFPLSSGRLISMSLVEKARPTELAHLELWDPLTPGPSVEERARLLLGEPVDAARPGAREREREQVAAAEAEAHAPGAESPGAEAELAAQVEARARAAAQRDREAAERAAKAKAEAEARARAEAERLAELAKPTPIELTVERVRDELRLMREVNPLFLSEGRLDAISVEEGGSSGLVRIDDGVIFNADHPQFLRAVVDPDPVWISFLTSSAYTALNTWLEDVTDEDELAFHGEHAKLLLSALLTDA